MWMGAQRVPSGHLDHMMWCDSTRSKFMQFAHSLAALTPPALHEEANGVVKTALARNEETLLWLEENIQAIAFEDRALTQPPQAKSNAAAQPQPRGEVYQ